MLNQDHIVVIGGGISGALSTLISSKTNNKVTWINFKNKLFGGIQLPPNSIQCLKKLGYYEKIKKYSNLVTNIRIRNSSSLSDLYSLDLCEDYFTIERQLLYSIIEKDIKKNSSVKILNTSINHIKTHKKISQCSTAEGNIINANLIIGADGYNGITRRYVVGEKPEFIKGKKIRRTVISINPREIKLSNTVSLWVENGWHLVIYPLNSRKLNVVLVSKNIPNFEKIENEILQKLINIKWYDSKIIKKIDYPTFCFQNLVLVGDAAHPFPPHLAQGAAQTFEDIIILYEKIVKLGISEKMILSYSNHRTSKTKNIMDMSNLAGKILGLSGSKSFIRDNIIKFSGPLINSYISNVWKL